MTSEERFRLIVRGLLAIGVKPTPTKLNRFMRRTRSRSNSINGREAQWRRQELLADGWNDPWNPANRTDRWSKP